MSSSSSSSISFVHVEGRAGGVTVKTESQKACIRLEEFEVLVDEQRREKEEKIEKEDARAYSYLVASQATRAHAEGAYTINQLRKLRTMIVYNIPLYRASSLPYGIVNGDSAVLLVAK